MAGYAWCVDPGEAEEWQEDESAESLDSIKTINDSVKLDEQRILREAEVTT